MATNPSEQQALFNKNSGSPPPYIGYTQPVGVAYVPHGHPAPIVVHPNIVVVRQDRRRCRFFKAFLMAILLFCLIKFVLLSFLRGVCYWGKPRWSIGPGDQSPGYPIPAGIDLVSCTQPLRNGDPRTILGVDPSSDTALFMAVGSKLHGSIRITTGKHDFVKVYVDLESRGEEKDTIVCSITRADGENGVGIFNPRKSWTYRDHVKYDVVVEFPENYPIISRLETDMANSVHTIDDIKDKILFKNIQLRGSNGGIYSKSIAALWANIETSNGHIEGHYDGSDHLTLYSSNGRIDVDVDFNQVNSSSANLFMATSNAPIRARLRLHDRTSTKEATNFMVSTHTSNSPLDVTFLEAPLYSTLDYKAVTSNSPAVVTLDPTFEGQFSLASSTFFTPVVNQRHVEDPYGKGRHRIVTRRTFRGLVSGDISWGNDSKGVGKVSVTTSNSRVTLNV